MPEHDKVEHKLPNGDILIVDSTVTDKETAKEFKALRESLRADARDAFRELREAMKTA